MDKGSYSGAYYLHKKPIPIPVSREYIYEIGKEYYGEYRILFYLLYLTGGRISEVLKLRRDDIEERGDVLLVNLYTAKNKLIDFRNLPIINDGIYKKMLDPVIEYVNQSEYGLRLFKMTRQMAYNNLSRKWITIRATHKKRVIENYKLKLRPHYLRHCRLTHLVTVHNFNEFSLMQFAGWTNIKPAMFYVRQNWKDLVSRMRDFQIPQKE